MSIFARLGFVAAAGWFVILAAPFAAAVPTDPTHPRGESVLAENQGSQPNASTPSFGSSTDPSLSRKLNESGGVIQPPGDVDPGMNQVPPKVDPRSTPVIPPAVPPEAPK